MPKKSKIVQDESERATGNGAVASNVKTNKKPSARRSRTSQKALDTTKKASIKQKTPKSSKPAPAIEPTDEEIRIRAYFVAERRHRLELPGDASSDWLEAKRQLLSEIGPR